MKYNAIAKKLSMTTLAAAMLAAPAINVFAATNVNIDTNQKGSITIHKYDVTAAKAKGFDETKYKANGEKNTQAEAELQNYKIQNVEFTYLKVGDISTDTVGGKIQVMYDIPEDLEDILGLSKTRADHKHSSTELVNAMEAALKKNTYTKNKLEKYIMTGYGHKAMPMTDKDGVSTATSLPLGLYLIVETKVPANVIDTTDPFFVSLPMTNDAATQWFYDVHAYPKNQTNIPDLNKRVRQHDDVELGKPEYLDTVTSSEGEKVDYTITSHLPRMTSSATYLTKYTFVDTIAKGLTYNRDISIYFYDNEGDAVANNVDNAVAHWDTTSDYFTASYNAASEKASQCTIAMTTRGLEALNHTDENDENQKESDYSGKWMVLSYTAKLNADATTRLGDAGNNNNVTLTWQRTNMAVSDTLEDKCRVFTYGIDMQKDFGVKTGTTQKPDASVVQFSLKNVTDGYFVKAKQDKQGSGIYYVVDENKESFGAGKKHATEEEAEKNATIFTPSPEGKLVINGLEANDYVLTELKTVPGYTLLKDSIQISIKQTQDSFTPSKTTLYDIVEIENNPNKHCIEQNGDRASATVDGSPTEMASDTNTTDGTEAGGNGVVSTNARVKLTVTNDLGVELPATGGAGTIAFTVAGCTVAFVGVMVATRKNKKDDEK